eukprot:NODE_6200_length_913_cov_38.415190_g5608_i0.p1 GENE.NODE_6200_length_913_cov_38.415190_g5608_i0~~NODE_6200_length_913_cov_38.415190_g5608_i0.p1  ORF type:complete len:208 (-),score=45.79 NODE_6200_length_913_cov_38.415190_g5608_i0:288-881(-)
MASQNACELAFQLRNMSSSTTEYEPTQSCSINMTMAICIDDTVLGTISNENIASVLMVGQVLHDLHELSNPELHDSIGSSKILVDDFIQTCSNTRFNFQLIMAFGEYGDNKRLMYQLCEILAIEEQNEWMYELNSPSRKKRQESKAFEEKFLDQALHSFKTGNYIASEEQVRHHLEVYPHDKAAHYLLKQIEDHKEL